MTQPQNFAADSFVPPELYTEIQQFYVRQLGLLDQTRIAEWAELFTEDAVFDQITGVALQGRDVIRKQVLDRADEVVEKGLDYFRHWLGMLDVRPQDDGSLRVRAYSLAMHTPTGGALNIHASVVMEDVLVRQDGGWKVSHRNLTLDGRPA
ncbi:nuclear transport factor 2 family protein [Streptomyces sp. DH8]|uniref:nuclear transport factor 2 family protein n=1 Tax=Streptomyces sp. DH8 TaxID=2857008 RepID=UPI001E572817|nr:nuclear transport factor 2 family protein [Streptomyces sp. DH8]